MKITFKTFLLAGFVLGGAFYGSAQTKEQREKIVRSYDLQKLSELERNLESEYIKNKSEVLRIADAKGWPVFIKNEDGSFAELQKISPEGKPLYYSTYNAGSAVTSRVNKINSGGSLGLNLNGQGMIAGVWDGGAVLATHQDLTGRVVIKDGVLGTADHPTHVTGTIIGSGGGNANAKGMAYQATAWTNDWNNDEAEVVNQISQGLLLSNHSYGLVANQVPLYYFGAYIQDSKNWDNIMFNAPYYLMVVAAGNDRNNNPASNPTKNGYDLLTGHTTSKNGIVVGAVNQVSNYTSASSVTMSAFSNFGPTDDGRIKPDIVTKGVSVTSTLSSANNAYGSMNGTSMASPGVTGTLLLLQQHYNNVNNNYMKAATLKALAIHTADEAGLSEGPDYSYGWGLINAERAATVISGNGINSQISEYKLTNNQPFTTTVTATGTEPLMATISWTDPSGNVNTGTVDLATPVLVNDLDIRITQNTNTYLPWKLNPATPTAAATRGDNLVDPLEKVAINNPSGAYTITVTNKGSLQGGAQDFSLVVTGIGSSFNINSPEPAKTVCSTSNAVYTFNYQTLNANQTALTYSNLPANATINFSQSSINANGTFTATIGNLANVLPGQYAINITGTNGTESKIYTIELSVYRPTFTPIVNVSPADNNTNVELYSPLEWQSDPNAESYTIQLATDVNFTNIVESVTLPATESIYYPVNAVSNQQYFWRVKAINLCGEGAYNVPYKFTTQNLNCVSVSNTTAAVISDFPEVTITSQINFTEDIDIDDINVSVDISHTAVQDLRISLTSPSGTTVILQEFCGADGDVNAVYDDQGVLLVCGSSTSVISGRLKPNQFLSAFEGENSVGTWTLTVFDGYFQNGGTLNSWGIQICEVADLSTGDFELDSFSLWPNPAGSFANIKFNSQNSDKVNVEVFDLNGRKVLSNLFDSTGGMFQSTLNIEALSSGVYMVKVNQGDKQAVAKLVKK